MSVIISTNTDPIPGQRYKLNKRIVSVDGKTVCQAGTEITLGAKRNDFAYNTSVTDIYVLTEDIEEI